jgi:hypothetical protein
MEQVRALLRRRVLGEPLSRQRNHCTADADWSRIQKYAHSAAFLKIAKVFMFLSS